MIGTTIAHYRITAKLGEGGMGAVYRATDMKLNREVAIKVLPEAFAADPDRMGRFRREAQVLAALNHPNIATIYGVEERAIIMELVEGADLSGPMPVAEALPIARQIAGALEAAHEKGIVHRDLKPANVKITPDGVAKVLDFGLATAPEPAPSGNPATSPTLTLTLAATQAGLILGTAGYMSPEQARGQPTDNRGDIWSFGVVLFEVLTGRRMFAGETISDMLAQVLTREPDWAALPSTTPPAIAQLLRRCLTRDRKQRLLHIGEARIALNAAITNPEPVAPAVTAPAPTRRGAMAAMLAGVAGVGGIAGYAIRGSHQGGSNPMRRFRISFAPIAIRSELQFSPDGRRIAFLGSAPGARNYSVGIQQFDGSPPRLISGTTSLAGVPSFALSPDGNSIMFTRDGEMFKVAISNGSPIRVVGNAGRISDWTSSGRILFRTADGKALLSVAEDGTGLETILDGPDGTTPTGIPGTQSFLMSYLRPGSTEPVIAVKPYRGGKPEIIVPQLSQSPKYVASGYVVYRAGARPGAPRFAVPFDVSSLKVTGPAVAVENANGFASCINGDAAFVVPSPRTSRLLMANRGGQVREISIAEPFGQLSASPDGKRLLLAMATSESDIWSYDLERNVKTRLTEYPGEEETAIWAPDSKRFAFVQQTARRILVRQADGGGGETLLWTAPDHVHLRDWSPDGKWIIVGGTTQNLLLAALEKAEPKPLVSVKGRLNNAAFSPNGRWLAYESEYSGRGEIYVCPFPESGGRVQLSSQGGSNPRWSRDGRELFFRSGEAMIAVSVSLSGDLAPGLPKTLFQRKLSSFDVLPDGSFVMFDAAGPEGDTEVDIVLNWATELRRIAPGK